MKVLFILNTGSTDESLGLSGGDVRVYKIIEFIKERHDVSLLGFFSSKRLNESHGASRSRIRRYSLYDRLSPYVSLFLRCLDALLSLAAVGNAHDALYAPSDYFADVIPAFCYKLRNPGTVWVQCIFHINGDWRSRTGSRLVNFLSQCNQRFSFFFIRRFADVILVINGGTRDRLVEMGFRPEALRLVYCGVDARGLEALAPDRRKYDGVFLGRLNRTKGIYDLVGIWESVRAEIPGAKLAVIGGGPEDRIEELRRRIKAAGMEGGVDVLGFQKDDSAYRLLKAAKVFLFPSHEEGWGMAIAEAMACGLPVVAWDLPVYRGIFGETIVRVKENETEAFARSVVGFLRDDERRRREGSDALEFVRRYDWAQIGRNEERILEEARESMKIGVGRNGA